jgi:hypothetical protein
VVGLYGASALGWRLARTAIFVKKENLLSENLVICFFLAFGVFRGETLNDQGFLSQKNKH